MVLQHEQSAHSITTGCTRHDAEQMGLTMMYARFAAAASSYFRLCSSSSARQRASNPRESFSYSGVPGRCSASRNCIRNAQAQQSKHWQSVYRH